MKKKRAWPLYIFLAYLIMPAFIPGVLASENKQVVNKENLSSNQQTIEQGWVEEKISPSTQWIESIFAPFTHWMEGEIHQKQETSQAQFKRPSETLISVQQAIDSVLKNFQGRILRSQFKTGPPPYYQIKTLSKEGAISTFFVHAFTGKLFIPASIKKNYQEGE